MPVGGGGRMKRSEGGEAISQTQLSEQISPSWKNPVYTPPAWKCICHKKNIYKLVRIVKINNCK